VEGGRGSVARGRAHDREPKRVCPLSPVRDKHWPPPAVSSLADKQFHPIAEGDLEQCGVDDELACRYLAGARPNFATRSSKNPAEGRGGAKLKKMVA
jgi:hypothetical protein